MLIYRSIGQRDIGRDIQKIESTMQGKLEKGRMMRNPQTFFYTVCLSLCTYVYAAQDSRFTIESASSMKNFKILSRQVIKSFVQRA